MRRNTTIPALYTRPPQRNILAQTCRFPWEPKDAVAAELTLYATEEFTHATLLTTHIINLGGLLVTDPK